MRILIALGATSLMGLAPVNNEHTQGQPLYGAVIITSDGAIGIATAKMSQREASAHASKMCLLSERAKPEECLEPPEIIKAAWAIIMQCTARGQQEFVIVTDVDLDTLRKSISVRVRQMKYKKGECIKVIEFHSARRY